MSAPPPAPQEPDQSPIFLWAALLVGLVIMGLVTARFLGRL